MPRQEYGTGSYRAGGQSIHALGRSGTQIDGEGKGGVVKLHCEGWRSRVVGLMLERDET